MEYVMLIKANIRRQKGNFVGLFLLFLLISLCTSTVFTIWLNSESYIAEEVDRIGYGTFTSWVYDNSVLGELVKQIEANQNVEKVELDRCILSKVIINGIESESAFDVIMYEDKGKNYHLLNESMSGFAEKPRECKEGEILVSPSFMEMYDCKIGDTLTLKLAEGEGKDFIIAGSVEDPITGGALMGIKTIIICQKDYEALAGYLVEDAQGKYPFEARTGGMIHVYGKEECMSAGELQQLVNESTKLGNYAEYSYSRQAMIGYMMVLQNIFVAFLLVFVAILLLVTVIIIVHSIHTNIEQQYTNMGILKAVGFSKNQIRMPFLLQYVISMVLGIVTGLPVSKLLNNVVNKALVPSTGILVPTGLPMLEIGSIMGGIVLILLLLILCKTRQINKITPIQSIRKGREDVHFDSRFKFPIYRSGMSFWLALRQIVAEKRQYIGVFLISVLLVFFISLTERTSSWIENGDMVENFELTEYDFVVFQEEGQLQGTKTVDEIVERAVSKYTTLESSFELNMVHATIDHVNYSCNVISEPERTHLLKGRYCKYDNEVMITEFLAKELGLSMGDKVTVSYGEDSAEYVISGYYECANDMGMNFTMSKEGFQKMVGNSGNYYHCYEIADTAHLDEILEEIEDDQTVSLEIAKNEWSGEEVIVSGANILGGMMYLVTFLFIAVVVMMTGSKIMYKEKYNLGIYKAVGFCSAELRGMFTLRFCVISLLGSFFGVVSSVLLADSLIGVIMRLVGISRFSSTLNLFGMVLPMLAVILAFTVFAYMASRKIKAADLEKMIREE